MEVESTNIASLLQEVNKTIIKHEALAKERGEDFNLFSIMGMESNETNTHSAMLAALLGPEHCHYKKTLFLEKFLGIIGYVIKKENLEKTKVIKEFHIGKIDSDYEKGGFIDILIRFDSGRTIAIENKIYAKDQRKQLYRYSKYNEGNTTLIYLNLYGDEPAKDSYHSLELKAIQRINYKEDIINWLIECRKSLKNDSILSLSIKQYIFLLKKITKTMDKTREKELTKSILNNYEAAQYVRFNLDKLINDVRESFRQAVIEKLQIELNDKNYRIISGNASDYHFSQIWVELDKTRDLTLRFGIESFSGKGNEGGKIFVGVFDRLTKEINIRFANEETDKHLSEYWPVIRLIKTIERNSLHLNSGNLLQKLNDQNSKSFKDLRDSTVAQIINFIKDYTEIVKQVDLERV